jgi:hypothetical protein
MSPWPDTRVVLLRDLAEQGLSGSEISREMDLTKNQVVGKCRRLGIRLQGDNQGNTGRPRSEQPAVVVRKPVVEAPVIAPPLAPVRPMPPARGCQWHDGTSPMWRVCDMAVKPGTAWCPEHHARVYPRYREPVA